MSLRKSTKKKPGTRQSMQNPIEKDEAKLQFPLIKDDKELDNMLVEMLGPEKAKEFK